MIVGVQGVLLGRKAICWGSVCAAVSYAEVLAE